MRGLFGLSVGQTTAEESKDYIYYTHTVAVSANILHFKTPPERSSYLQFVQTVYWADVDNKEQIAQRWDIAFASLKEEKEWVGS